MSTQSLIHKTKDDFLLDIESIFIKMADAHLRKKKFLLGDGYCVADFMLLCDIQSLMRSLNCTIRELYPDYEEQLNCLILKYK